MTWSEVGEREETGWGEGPRAGIRSRDVRSAMVLYVCALPTRLSPTNISLKIILNWLKSMGMWLIKCGFFNYEIVAERGLKFFPIIFMFFYAHTLPNKTIPLFPDKVIQATWWKIPVFFILQYIFQKIKITQCQFCSKFCKPKNGDYTCGQD